MEYLHMNLLNPTFAAAIAQIILINVVLSGDNALVIAMAARNLPMQHQKKAVIWGGVAAICMRVVLTVIAVQLLRIPFVQFIGGLLLVWISIKLLIDQDKGLAESSFKGGLFGAIKTILIADVVMSMDNTLAIAAVAKGDWALLILCLTLSIPLIVMGSTAIMKVMDRFPTIIYLAAGIIAWTAGEMIESDASVKPFLENFQLETHNMPIALTIGVVMFGWLYNRRQMRKIKI